MKGWEKYSWGDLVTLEYGKSLTGYRESEGNIPVFGTNGPIGWTNRALCEFPSVIIGRKGAYRGVHYSNQPFFVIDTAFYLNPKVPNLDLKYAYYKLLAVDINSLDSGSAIPSTSRDDFYALPISLPPLAEQKAIASILSSLDDKIELNNRINKNLDAMAQAIFKRWFIDFEFPNEDGKPYKSSGGKMEDSEIGKIPEGWETRSLDEIANYLNGLALQKYPVKEGDDNFPVIKIRELRQGLSSATDRSSKCIPDEYIVRNGDVLFSWSGTLVVDFWCQGDGALNQHLFKITSEHFPKWFYYLWTASYLGDFITIAKDKATTMGHIQRRHLQEAKVFIPHEKALIQMGQTLGPVIDEIITNRVMNNDLSKLRDILLTKLMSGKMEIVK